jgi:CPA1 family monovalent cation:H+ antiporter
MRGVVSLAAALSLPLALNGSAFPQRNVILLITFIVILFTLLLQGLTLPYVIKKLGIVEMDQKLSKDEQATTIRLRMTQASLTYLNNKYPDEIVKHEIFQQLKAHYENIASIMNKKLENIDDNDSSEKEIMQMYNRVLLELITVQRQELIAMRSDIQLDYVLLLNQQNRLDLEEARIDHRGTIH